MTKDRSQHEMRRGKRQASSSLRDLSDKETETTISEIEGGTDRVSGIMAANLLQNTLCGAIIRQLKDKAEVAKLFDERGPLNTFETQIMLGRALGLYNGRVEDMLHLIRKIRNKFAHSVVSMDFKDAQIEGWCSTLKPFADKDAERKGEISDARRYYEDACFHFVETIWRKIGNDMDERIRELEEKIERAGTKVPSAVSTTQGLGNLLQLVSTSLNQNGK